MTTTSFIPETPKFGGREQVSADTWVTWTGGKPKADWSGLEDPNPKTIQPNRYRTTSVTSQSKSLRYRTQGLETKLTRDSDFQIFQKKFMKLLVAHGMDTIACAADPSDATKVMSVATDHAKCDLRQDLTWACTRQGKPM